jgi:hypothetical protein
LTLCDRRLYGADGKNIEELNQVYFNTTKKLKNRHYYIDIKVKKKNAALLGQAIMTDDVYGFIC